MMEHLILLNLLIERKSYLQFVAKVEKDDSLKELLQK